MLCEAGGKNAVVKGVRVGVVLIMFNQLSAVHAAWSGETLNAKLSENVCHMHDHGGENNLNKQVKGMQVMYGHETACWGIT